MEELKCTNCKYFVGCDSTIMGVCNKYKPQRCKGYLGATCASGGCPIALQDEYAERGHDIVHNCDECPYYKGCEDCAFEGSNICPEKLLKGESK